MTGFNDLVWCLVGARGKWKAIDLKRTNERASNVQVKHKYHYRTAFAYLNYNKIHISKKVKRQEKKEKCGIETKKEIYNDNNYNGFNSDIAQIKAKFQQWTISLTMQLMHRILLDVEMCARTRVELNVIWETEFRP